jgi:hypothetical protein
MSQFGNSAASQRKGLNEWLAPHSGAPSNSVPYPVLDAGYDLTDVQSCNALITDSCDAATVTRHMSRCLAHGEYQHPVHVLARREKIAMFPDKIVVTSGL